MQWKWHEIQLDNFCVCLEIESMPEEISLHRFSVGTPFLSWAFFAVLFLWYR